MFSYNIVELTRQDRKLWDLSVSQSRCVNKQLARCPFCWLVFIKEWWRGRHRDSQGKDTLPLSLHSQRCKEKRNSSKCICQRFFFSWWGFCHFLRPKVPVIKRAVPASLSPQGPKCPRGQTKGGCLLCLPVPEVSQSAVTWFPYCGLSRRQNMARRKGQSKTVGKLWEERESGAGTTRRTRSGTLPPPHPTFC